MSSYDWLICDESGEIVEVVAHVGNYSTPRIEPNALGAFLLYHRHAHPGATLRIGSIESDEKGVFDSVQERADFGSALDYIAWDKNNYQTLAGRDARVASGLAHIEEIGSYQWTHK